MPCPVRPQEISDRKAAQHRKSRMDARTRERLPALPALAAAVDRQRKDAAALLTAARQALPGQEFTAAGPDPGPAPRPPAAPRSRSGPATRPPASARPGRPKSYAFWAWAAIEVLRSTGIRIEELLELSHHSLVQYRLPGTGELVPLLQITPSKTDAERLLLVSPDLADVLAAIISRVRAPSGAIPLVAAYDRHERRWRPPAPVLFQRRFRGYDQAIQETVLRKMLAAAIAQAGIADPATGQPLAFTPHDFRRMFITDAVLNGLPPHIAQVIAGHRDINVTMGYKAVYPDEAIQAHLAFLARRRALRPGQEYRAPTDAEWQQFLGHFEHRKVATGTCGRAFATPCVHEHACIRCPMLWPDPAQKDRLDRNPRQPHRPHRRSRTRRLARRNGRTQDQPRRSTRQTRPDQPPPENHNRPRNPRDPHPLDQRKPDQRHKLPSSENRMPAVRRRCSGFPGPTS